jgi:hypothetical protein
MARLFLPVAPVLMALVLACNSGAPVNPPAGGAGSPPGGSGSPTVAATAAPQIAPAGFFLEVSAPQNEVVVNQSPLPVKGATAPDAVATVNGLEVDVDAQGQFVAQVPLEEGPNTIEVLASDFLGNQEGRTLTVIYIP